MCQLPAGRMRRAVTGVTLLVLLLLPATWSRAALVAVAGVALWVYRRLYWRWRWAVWTAVGLTAIGAYLMKQGSADGRLLTWMAALTTWLGQPWTGVGIGGFCHACAEGIDALYVSRPNSPLLASGGVTDYAFCDGLKVLVEQGVAGAVLCVLTVSLVLANLWRCSRPLCYGAVSLLLFSMFSYPFELLPYRVLAVLLAAWSAEAGWCVGRMWHWTAVLFFGGLMALAWLWRREVGRRMEADREAQLFAGMHHAAFIKDYYELLPWEQDHAQFLFDFGQTLRKAGRYNDSNDLLRHGTRVSGDPMFHVLMGNNYHDMQCDDLAERAYWKAFRVMPNRMYPLYQLMLLYEARHDAARAREVARRIVAMRPKVESPATEEMKRKAKVKLTEFK